MKSPADRKGTPKTDPQLLNPLITDDGLRIIERLRSHPDAPKWNHEAGDRVELEDLAEVDLFRTLLADRAPWADGERPAWLLEWAEDRRPVTPWFRKLLPEAGSIASNWASIPTTSRETIAAIPEELVPDDIDLARMVVYRTSGTTGHALVVPHHPRAASLYLALIEEALRRYGICPGFDSSRAGCILIGIQAHTVTYATALALWNQCGFAKINLSAPEWPTPESPKRYLEAMNPLILTGDPISFAEILRIGPAITPLAMISTAVAMSPALSADLRRRFACPVIEWYSLTETGPIGYACRAGYGYHVLPHDIFVEVLNSEGEILAPGQRGEITVSGGRNPYVPLLRYRTGDWGALSFDKCSCGDPMPRIVDLEGRKPIVFNSKSGITVNPVDISRVLREYPLLQHEFNQKADLSCELTIRIIPGHEDIGLSALRDDLVRLFGGELDLKLSVDDSLGMRHSGGKAPAYSREALLED